MEQRELHAVFFLVIKYCSSALQWQEKTWQPGGCHKVRSFSLLSWQWCVARSPKIAMRTCPSRCELALYHKSHYWGLKGWKSEQQDIEKLVFSSHLFTFNSQSPLLPFKAHCPAEPRGAYSDQGLFPSEVSSSQSITFIAFKTIIVVFCECCNLRTL